MSFSSSNDHVIVRLLDKDKKNTTMYTFKLFQVWNIFLNPFSWFASIWNYLKFKLNFSSAGFRLCLKYLLNYWKKCFSKSRNLVNSSVCRITFSDRPIGRRIAVWKEQTLVVCVWIGWLLLYLVLLVYDYSKNLNSQFEIIFRLDPFRFIWIILKQTAGEIWSKLRTGKSRSTTQSIWPTQGWL